MSRQTAVAQIPAPEVQTPSAGGQPRSNTVVDRSTIYLCRAYDGGTFWAQAHCNQHKAIIERIARVPESLQFNQQVEVAAAQQRSIARATTVPNNTVDLNAINLAAAKNARCSWLEAEIKRIDDQARQPQSGQSQDWLAARRKELRDEQFRLPCR